MKNAGVEEDVKECLMNLFPGITLGDTIVGVEETGQFVWIDSVGKECVNLGMTKWRLIHIRAAYIGPDRQVEGGIREG